MFGKIKKIFKTDNDSIETKIKELFCFLIDDYGFSFTKNDLGNLLDKNGRLVFYGPLYAYQIYNDRICINILYLVQRQDYNIFITDKYSKDQQYIHDGVEVPSDLAYDLVGFASKIKSEILSQKTICGKDF